MNAQPESPISGTPASRFGRGALLALGTQAVLLLVFWLTTLILGWTGLNDVHALVAVLALIAIVLEAAWLLMCVGGGIATLIRKNGEHGWGMLLVAILAIAVYFLVR